MRVESIVIGPSEALAPVDSVEAVAGQGLVGDRKATKGVNPGGALTLIEAEVLEDVGVRGREAGRQVVVRGVRLNALVASASASARSSASASSCASRACTSSR